MSDPPELLSGPHDDTRPGAPGGRAPEPGTAAEPDQPDQHPSFSETAAGAGARAVRYAIDGAGDVVDSVVSAGARLGSLTRPVVDRVQPTVRAAVRRWREREAARIRRLRAMNKDPLPNLYEIYPEARLAPLRELGLQTISIDEIRGTAVAGPAQRGRDFLPPPRFRTSNWIGRWQRIRKAMDRLATLPPIEVLKTAEGYWVADGHNRVAAALYANQVAIDALVTAVRLSGEPVEPPSGSLAAMLEGAGELQAAAAGRLTPGSSIAERGFEHRESAISEDDHTDRADRDAAPDRPPDEPAGQEGRS